MRSQFAPDCRCAWLHKGATATNHIPPTVPSTSKPSSIGATTSSTASERYMLQLHPCSTIGWKGHLVAAMFSFFLSIQIVPILMILVPGEKDDVLMQRIEISVSNRNLYLHCQVMQHSVAMGPGTCNSDTAINIYAKSSWAFSCRSLPQDVRRNVASRRHSINFVNQCIWHVRGAGNFVNVTSRR